MTGNIIKNLIIQHFTGAILTVHKKHNLYRADLLSSFYSIEPEARFTLSRTKFDKNTFVHTSHSKSPLFKSKF